MHRFKGHSVKSGLGDFPMCSVAWPGYFDAVQSGQIFFKTKIYSYAPCSGEGGLVGAVAGDVR